MCAYERFIREWIVNFAITKTVIEKGSVTFITLTRSYCVRCVLGLYSRQPQAYALLVKATARYPRHKKLLSAARNGEVVQKEDAS